MRIGGVERSLLGLLNSLDYDKFDVDLFLFIHDGEFLKMIPEQVNLLPPVAKYADLLLPAKDVLKKGNIDVLLLKLWARYKAFQYVKKNSLNKNNLVLSTYLQKFVSKCLPRINDIKYDFGISFLTPHYILSDKVTAEKSIAWIHTDYSFFDVDQQEETTMWNKYTYIASISDDCTNAFCSKFPSLLPKVILIENILSSQFVIEQAKLFTVSDEIPSDDHVVKIISVGRFSYQKNFDNVPEIVRILQEDGCNVKWYLIGYGGDEGLIMNKIKEFGVEDKVILLGKKSNPYPYILATDIYVQPSRYEGKAVAVREAQILCKPVIITNFPTANSQLRNGIDGIVVPLDNIGCAKEIKEIIENKSLTDLLVKNCANGNFSNEEEILKLESLI